MSVIPMPVAGEVDLPAVEKLSREIKTAGALIDRDQARFLVDLYYRWQEHRIALRGQSRALASFEKPTELVDHFAVQAEALEKQMVGVLDVFSTSTEVGRWSREQMGVGPVIAAGLMAHIDIERARTAGAIWRFAGLDPTVKWGKGEKRPWNADLKVLCWKLGDSFVKVSGRDTAFYGHIYRERKALEVQRNEAGEFADQAAATLVEKKITERKTRAAYEAGLLPDGRIDLRARRYAVKLFLAHWHEVAFTDYFGEAPPVPYPIAHLGHVHKIDPPGR